MKSLKWLMVAFTIPVLAACGGGDTEDRLDIADPKLRVIHAIPAGPNVSLFRETVQQADATDVGYKFASRYFDVSSNTATWTIRPASNTSITLASLNFDSQRGHRDTIVALPGASGVDALLIDDPYNKGLTSDKARVRVVNAAINAQAIDVYLTNPSDDIATRNPDFGAVGFKEAMPGSGSDSIEFSGGTYLLRITTAGTKDVIFSAQVDVQNNADWLVLPIPTGGLGVVVPNDIKVLLVQGNDTDNGTTQEITNAD